MFGGQIYEPGTRCRDALRLNQSFARALTACAETGFRRNVETLQFDPTMTGKANTIFAFGNSRQSVLDLHYFVCVPVREIIEQMDSAFVRRAIEPLLILVDNSLFRLQMFASLNNFVTPSSQSLVIPRIVNSIHCVLPQAICAGFGPTRQQRL